MIVLKLKYEDLLVQESTCKSNAVGNEYTGLNVLTVMRFNCLNAWKFHNVSLD